MTTAPPSGAPRHRRSPWRPLPAGRRRGAHRRPVAPLHSRLAGLAVSAVLVVSLVGLLEPIAAADPEPVLLPIATGSGDPPDAPPLDTAPPPAVEPVDPWAAGDLTGGQLAALLPPVTTTILVSMFAPVTPEWLVGDLHSEGYSVEFREAASLDECRIEAADLPITDPRSGRYDPNLIAQLVHRLFECSARVGGLGEVEPTRNRRWDAAAAWGFASLAEQVAAEAVVVAYCETEGFDPRALTRNNPWGYGGLFQMGSSEMRRFGSPGASKFDPLDNAIAAAAYFLHQARAGDGWGGWGPWAVVNTNFDDEVNNKVRIPVLPRFRSTDPEFAGRRGPELPAWAVDPWAWQVPGWGGCPYTGGRWAEAAPLLP